MGTITIGTEVEYETEQDEVFYGKIMKYVTDDIVIINTEKGPMQALVKWCTPCNQTQND